jgi:hypothetical protein
MTTILNPNQAAMLMAQGGLGGSAQGTIGAIGPNMTPQQYQMLKAGVAPSTGCPNCASTTACTCNRNTATTSSITTTNGTSNYIFASSNGSTTTRLYVSPQLYQNYNIPLGLEAKIKLPNGAILEVQKDGSYSINDKGVITVIRPPAQRNFNTYLNASDRLEEFIKYCGELGLKQDELLNLPINSFIMWLILESAKADQEPTPDDVKLLPSLLKQKYPRCIQCNKFISKEKVQRQIQFCKPKCFDRHYAKLAA